MSVTWQNIGCRDTCLPCYSHYACDWCTYCCIVALASSATFWDYLWSWLHERWPKGGKMSTSGWAGPHTCSFTAVNTRQGHSAFLSLHRLTVSSSAYAWQYLSLKLTINIWVFANKTVHILRQFVCERVNMALYAVWKQDCVHEAK